MAWRTAQRAAFAGVVLGIIAGAARVAAQQPPDRPPVLPTRDVGVIYRLSGGDMGNGAQKMQVTYADGGKRERIDYFRWAESTYPFAALIVDRPADHMIVIDGQARRYVEKTIGNLPTADALLTNPDLRFTREATATVAGLPCTDWHLQAVQEKLDRGTACITDDGVILRVMLPGVKQPAMVATTVRYGTPPQEVFVPPADFNNGSLRPRP